jgi:hypothetical protein
MATGREARDSLGAVACALRATLAATVFAADTRTRNETLYLPSPTAAWGSSAGRLGPDQVGSTGIGENLASEVSPTSPRILKILDTAPAKELNAGERRADTDAMNPDASMPIPQSLRA